MNKLENGARAQPNAENRASRETSKAMEALENAQAAFASEAARLGLRNEQDVVAMVKEVRREHRDCKD